MYVFGGGVSPKLSNPDSISDPRKQFLYPQFQTKLQKSIPHFRPDETWLTLEGSIFLALNYCCLADYQKLWYNCSFFVNTSFDAN